MYAGLHENFISIGVYTYIKEKKNMHMMERYLRSGSICYTAGYHRNVSSEILYRYFNRFY